MTNKDFSWNGQLNGYEFAVLRAVSNLYSEGDAEILAATLTVFSSANVILSAVDKHFARLGITQGRYVVLLLLAVEEEQMSTPSKLAELCGISRAAMTGLIDGLEKSGFVERSIHQSDRRALTIRLTASGQDFLRETAVRDRIWLAEKIGALNEKERSKIVESAKLMIKLFAD